MTKIISKMNLRGTVTTALYSISLGPKKRDVPINSQLIRVETNSGVANLLSSPGYHGEQDLSP